MTKPAHGLWIDDLPRVVMTNAYLDRFQALGFSVAAVMLETVTPGFDPKFKEDDLGRLGEMLRGRDIELVLTYWPEPRVAYMAQLAEKLPRFVRRSGAAAIEGDHESNWIGKKLVGYRSVQEASESLVLVHREIQKVLDVRTELTTFTFHAELGAGATVADDVDRVLGQGYSVRHRKDAKGKPFDVPWDHQFGPGKMQTLTFDRALQIPKKGGKPAISAGLAAYDQSWPGHRPEEAMRIAYETALRYQPAEVRWWSSKWVIGLHRQAYATRFFAELAR